MHYRVTVVADRQLWGKDTASEGIEAREMPRFYKGDELCSNNDVQLSFVRKDQRSISVDPNSHRSRIPSATEQLAMG